MFTTLAATVDALVTVLPTQAGAATAPEFKSTLANELQIAW
jgi:hypothetical protein